MFYDSVLSLRYLDNFYSTYSMTGKKVLKGVAKSKKLGGQWTHLAKTESKSLTGV